MSYFLQEIFCRRFVHFSLKFNEQVQDISGIFKIRIFKAPKVVKNNILLFNNKNQNARCGVFRELSA